MKVIITRNTFAKGKAYSASDKPQELSKEDASNLILCGKAVAVDKKGQPAKPSADKKEGGDK